LTPLIGSKATIVVDIAGLTGNLVILPIALMLLSFGQALGPSPEMGKPASPRAAMTTTIPAALGVALHQPVVLTPAIAILLVLTGVQIPAVQAV
jgi:hypothetical protein